MVCQGSVTLLKITRYASQVCCIDFVSGRYSGGMTYMANLVEKAIFGNADLVGRDHSPANFVMQGLSESGGLVGEMPETHLQDFGLWAPWTEAKTVIFPFSFPLFD
ncbi:hypothetical protein N7510_000074 [Penicillium lagena]|uniref:uncharacterized protein n=1 Tax=Penicillium lagena TaxID=94218 RepID=UPI002540A223|nr:uncharacterized protein N7510_000074 [Penicillium lagena]KAJ5623765.1 hypothetical protein N7510_000074 [Penicillium lagena]